MTFNLQQYNTEFWLSARDKNEPINSAREKYGTNIIEADIAEGETYWRVIGVHHLLPRENFGNHHVYIEALDEQGKRIQNPLIWAGWTWRNRQPHERADPVGLDKPSNEPAGNITMHFGQIVSVWINGQGRDARDKSDIVENLHTTHPDEPLPDGALLNSLGHHSFYVVFQRSRKRRTGLVVGTISGRVERGQGQGVRLFQNDQVVAEQQLNQDLTFRFEKLPFGTYRLEVVGTEVRQDNLLLDVRNQKLDLNLAVPLPARSVILGQVQNGVGHILLLVKNGNIIARFPLPDSGQYRFENLADGTYSVQVFDTNIRQDNITVDGTNQRQVNLTVPLVQQVDKNINHYLLLSPPNTRGRQTNLLLATHYILTFSVTVGFSLAEAQRAQRVTIVGEGISPADQEALKNSGSEVEVLTGDPYELEAKFNARVLAGRAFGG